MPRLMVGTRIPEDWMNDLERIAGEKGCKVSHVIHDVIVTYLEKLSIAGISSNEKRISTLECKFKRLAG